MKAAHREKSAQKLSIAASLADVFVSSKLTQLFILACLMLGIGAILQTPREDNPQIIIPGASIRVELAGASAAEIEELVVRPLERGIKLISSVDKVYATAANSVAILSVQFKVGENQEDSLVKLYDRISSTRALLPPNVSLPLIRSMNVDDVPIVTVTLASQTYDDDALKRLADRLLEGVHSLPSVSAAYVQGGRDREIRVELDPERMQSYGVSLDQARSLLLAANISLPLGATVLQGQTQQVFLNGFLKSANDVGRIIIGNDHHRLIYLSDVADVVDGVNTERKTASRLGFGVADVRYSHMLEADMPAVTLAIAKQRGTNAVEVASQVLARIDRMKANFIPSGVEVVVTRNDGSVANDTVNGLIEHLMIAIFSVFCVTLVFLGRKEAFIVGMSVPLVLALTLGIAWMAGLTINRVSLFALILSLGLLVDDAIVVIENIHRHYAMTGAALNKRLTTINAAGEVGNPTNLATLAVILVFGSLLAVTGMSGEYFYPIAFSVPVAMASSLFVAYTVVPWAAYRWLSVHPANESYHHEAGTISHIPRVNRLEMYYQRLLKPFIDNTIWRRWCFVGVIGLILLSLFQPLWQFIRPAGTSGPQSWFGVEMTMMPLNNKNTFNITIKLPETAPLEETDRLTRAMADVIRRHPQVSNYQVWLGQPGIVDFSSLLRGNAEITGENIAEIRVNLRDKHQRDSSSMQIVRELRPPLQAVAAAFPHSVIQLLEDAPGPPVRSTILAEIYGSNPTMLREISTQVRQVFQQTWDVAEVNSSEPVNVQQQLLVVDSAKAALSGLTTTEVAMTLHRFLAGEYLGQAHLVGEKIPVPIRLVIPRRHQPDLTLLSRVYITNKQGLRVPLSTVVTLTSGLADKPIQRKNGERVSYVLGEMRQTAPAYAVLALDKRLDGLKLSDGSQLSTGNMRLTPQQVDSAKGYVLLWDGSQRQMLDTYRDMTGALGISIVFIFLILVAYYQSISIPIVAMAAIPLGLVGVFPGHWLMQAQFSATSMIGVIALAGVVIRNSLLIIDFVLEYRQQGMPLRDAILAAGAVRLRPILLTALAIVLGSAIMLTDPLFSGLAISLIFGTVAATLLTLIVIPLLLLVLLRRKEAKAGAL